MGHSEEPAPSPWSESAGQFRTFSVAEARDLLPQVRRQADELVTVRADLAELATDLDRGVHTALGGIAEHKALTARMSELRSWFLDSGLEVKGLAPLLLDFPAVLAGVSVRLCWLEGEQELAWYHRTDVGFAGRRALRPPD